MCSLLLAAEFSIKKGMHVEGFNVLSTNKILCLREVKYIKVIYLSSQVNGSMYIIQELYNIFQ
jgi:hypothetical protein